MGLAAGQARLLTITGRKSDCEFESMRLSHQKIALARELADLSNEYQNSLTKTKLFYDYYGTGDLSNQLSYGILMQPSALNNYMPTILTDSMGRVALNGKLAQAAALAGIPQEGLGTLPSDEMRNRFIQSLATAGVITPTLSETIQGLPYNQNAGLGGGTTVATMTDSGNYEKLLEYLNKNPQMIDLSVGSQDFEGKLQSFAFRVKNGKEENDYTDSVISTNGCYGFNENTKVSNYNNSFSIGDLLSGNTELDIVLHNGHAKNENEAMVEYANLILDDFIGQLGDRFVDVFEVGDGFATKAVEYAINQTTKQYASEVDIDNYGGRVSGDTDKPGRITEYANEYNRWIQFKYHQSNHNRVWSGLSINNLTQSFLTYYADFMNGVSATDGYGMQVFDVKNSQITNSKLAKDNDEFKYVWRVGSDVSSDDLGQATFYDALFNQICLNGWTENNNLNDNEYLQQMLQNGMLYISKLKDDGYYYQGNYSTDSYIKEVADETLIAAAEAKYNTEKAKLNAKEETIDLKMKNLDTEISALTTEYDTVKNTISKQIEKCFKRYNA